MDAWRWALAQLTRRLWLRASLYALAGVAAALLAAVFSPFVPKAFAEPFGGGTVDGLLNVLASSLLTVATFSATAMLSAYTSVASSVTPRASGLITSDSRAQTALASFVGGFLYSIVAFSALGTGYYAHGGRAILFVTTLAVMVWIAITLLRWLDHLSSLARMGKVIEKIEDATRCAMMGPFGAVAPAAPWTPPPADAQPLYAERVGYVRNVDLKALTRLAEREGLGMWVISRPGALVHEDRPLAMVQASGALDPRTCGRLRKAFDVSGSRSFDQDPRFGLAVLGEVASRALSPAVNDPGTALDVLGTALRLLTFWRRQAAQGAAAPSPPPAAASQRVRVRPLAYEDLLDDVLRPIASDGASTLPVALRLQKVLGALHAEAKDAPDVRRALEEAADDAAERAGQALTTPADRARVEAVHARMRDGAGPRPAS